MIFCGSGSTGAVDKLVGVLNLRLPADLDERYRLREHIPADERPVVFIGPYEHHSNELPWRESIADVVTIHEDADGHIDLAQLEASWSRYADRPLKIGSFSAASNVTGILSDTRAVSVAAARHGALVVLGLRRGRAVRGHRDEPATSAGGRATTRTRSSSRPTSSSAARARRACWSRAASCSGTGCPTVVGGGTVAYVNPERARLPRRIPSIARRAARRRSSSRSAPASCSSSRSEVGEEAIRRARGVVHPPGDRALGAPSRHRDPGQPTTPSGCRSSSFVGPARAGRYLHHNFVVALLNDLFGIQSRGGCSCAGPYGHRLLGIDLETSHEFEREIARGCEGIKPGWVRVNFNYFISETVFDYILDAVELVAARRLASCCRSTASIPRPACGATRPASPSRRCRLDDMRYADGQMRYAAHRHHEPNSSLADYLAEARTLLAGPPRTDLPIDRPDLDPEFELLRWFPLPSEVVAPSLT